MAQPLIYLDHAASTPVDARVLAAMQPYWTETYGNPSAAHGYGRAAARAVAEARLEVARHLGVRPEEIVFTGGGSASDNLALRGVMWAARAAGAGRHLITSRVEHPAVLATAVQLRDVAGFDLTVLPVDGAGIVSPDDVAAAIRPETVLISIMAANNEVGTLQPVAEIGRLARERGVWFHTDAIQAVIAGSMDLAQLPVDLVSLSPHKFYGPKGIGILVARQGVPLLPATTGGGQEDGRRSGTPAVPLVVGAAAALRLALAAAPSLAGRLTNLRDRLLHDLLDRFPGDCILTGHPTQRLPNHASVAFRHLSGNDLVMHLDMAGVAAGSGSACHTGNPRPSAVLTAMGLGPEWTRGGLRLTLGRQTTAADVDFALQALASIVPRLYKLRELAG